MDPGIYRTRQPDAHLLPMAGAEIAMDSTARRLLCRWPTLDDPNFFRSVVFVIEHNDEGAVGLVLNQPTEAPAHATRCPTGPTSLRRPRSRSWAGRCSSTTR